ncbi:MAG: hypothetical protein R6U04_05650 [Bacteroidales bacterium]
MKKTKSILITMIMVTITTLGYAQKGTGNNTGNATASEASKIEQLSGELQEILVEPCTKTTGRYDTGTHLLIKTNKGQGQTLNIHLGPTSELADITEGLEKGDEIQLKLFSTKDLPENQYVVKEFKYKGTLYELRDANLQPFWAENQRGGRGRTR